jgi:hypothetical protein
VGAIVKKKILLTHQSVHKYIIFSRADGWYEVYKYRYDFKLNRLMKRPEITLTPWWIDARRLAMVQS